MSHSALSLSTLLSPASNSMHKGTWVRCGKMHRGSMMYCPSGSAFETLAIRGGGLAREGARFAGGTVSSKINHELRWTRTLY